MSLSFWIASKARSTIRASRGGWRHGFAAARERSTQSARSRRRDAEWIVACLIALPSGGALADSEIYCEISSSNFAWGAQYGGTVIAPDGAVALFEYDFATSPADGEALFREDWLAPTRQELTSRFRPGRRVVGTLCADRRAWLRDQLAVVRTAGQSKIVDMRSRDGPTAHTRCFIFEPGTDAVSLVFLQESGDSESHSLSPAAPRLANWLSAVAAEARQRAKLPEKECIGELPPLTMPLYRDAVAEVRKRTMEELKATQQLHCQFSEGTRAEVDGEQVGNHDSPSQLSVVFTGLDSADRRAHAETFGDSYAVQIDSGAAGLTLTNVDWEKNRISDVVTIVPYRIGGREIYPAVKHQIFLHDLGAFAVRYTGQCAPLQKSR